MSKEARRGRPQSEQSQTLDLSKLHGSDRRKLRRDKGFKYAAIGHEGNSSVQGFLPESVIGTPAQNEGQPKI